MAHLRSHTAADGGVASKVSVELCPGWFTTTLTSSNIQSWLLKLSPSECQAQRHGGTGTPEKMRHGLRVLASVQDE